jgi:hypothetical protein
LDGQSRYCLTSPKGERTRGWWKITAIEAPRRLELEDGNADECGEPLNAVDPMQRTVTFEPYDSRTRMRIVTTFASKEQFQEMLDQGIKVGLRDALGQIDDLLAD